MSSFKLKTILIIGLLILFSSPFSSFAQGEAEGEQAIQARIQADDEQTRAEAERIDEAQRRDYDECKAEVNGGGSSGPGGSGGSGGSSGGNPNPQDQQQDNEEETRRELSEAGYTVNHSNDCNGMTYQAYQEAYGRSCTDVAGLPQHSIDRLAEIHDQAGCIDNITLTGGTEGGHSSHSQGRNVVDLERGKPCLNSYINEHTTSTWEGDRGTYHRLDNGDIFLDEGNHWHADLRGGTLPSNQTFAKNKLEPLFTLNWLEKNLRKIGASFYPATAEASLQSGQIEINGQLVDLNNIASAQLGTLVDSLNQSELEDLFTSITQNDLGTLLEKLPFDTLNESLVNLSDGTLNEIVGTLSQGTFDEIAISLTEETFGNLFEGFDSSSLSSLFNNVSNGPLSLALEGLETGSLDNIFSQITGGLANEVMNNLGVGALNNILGNLSGDLVDQVIGGLGLNSLNTIFSNIGLSTINEILPNLTSQTLSGILPNLGTEAVTQLLGGASADLLEGALNNIAPDIITEAVSKLPADLAQDLAASVPSIEEVLPGGVLPDNPLLDNPITGPVSQIIGGLYVPVVEQGGQLMDLTKSIDKTEKEIKDLSIQICTHLKAIRRIQSKFEQKEFIAEVGTRRVRATDLAKWKEGILGQNGIMQKGGISNDGQAEPLYVMNLDDERLAAEREADDKVFLYLKNSNNPHKTKIGEEIKKQKEENTELNPTITGSEIDKIIPQELFATKVDNNEIKSSMLALKKLPLVGLLVRPAGKLASVLGFKTSWAAEVEVTPSEADYKEKRDILLKLLDPEKANNRISSFLKTEDLRIRVAAIERQNARDRYIAAQGFKDTRECLEWVARPGSDPSEAGTGENMMCKKWIVTVPGKINSDSYFAAIDTTRQNYVNDPGMGSTGPGEGPDPVENLTGKPNVNGGGSPGPGEATSISGLTQIISETQSDSGVYVPPTPNTDNQDGGDNDSGNNNGSGEGGIDWLNFSDLFDFSIGNGNDSQSLSFLQQLLDFLGNLYARQKPLVHFKAKALEDNQFLLYWASPNAEAGCVAGNDWLSQTETTSTTPKKEGDSLGKSNTLNIAYPSLATTSLSVIYKIECSNNNGTTKKEILIEND